MAAKNLQKNSNVVSAGRESAWIRRRRVQGNAEVDELLCTLPPDHGGNGASHLGPVVQRCPLAVSAGP